MLGTPKEQAFAISLEGARRKNFLVEGSVQKAAKYLDGIEDLTDLSIQNACKLVTFDVWKRNAIAAISAKDDKNTKPYVHTIRNIRHMVENSLSFAKEFGPIVQFGFTFEPPDGNLDDY